MHAGVLEPIDVLAPRLAWLRRLPVTRDQAMLAIAAVSEIFTGVDTYFAHQAGGAIIGNEWIPVFFGPLAGATLLAAGVLALRRRMLAATIATAVFAASVVVGIAGAYFHLMRTILPSGPLGQRVALDFFFWAPPILGPLAFVFIGTFGTSAAWHEEPPGSGRLLLPAGLVIRLPYPKTNAYFYVTATGMLIALVSSALDHAGTGFHDPWLWLPIAVGVFATVVALMLGMLLRPTPRDLWTYVAAMLLAIVVGVIGSILHVEQDLASGGRFVSERLLRGAPFMAPLLFANMGLVGLLALLPQDAASILDQDNRDGTLPARDA
jgi:hypothetical protein